MGADAHSSRAQRDHGELGYSSKLNAEWQFINMLHGEGRQAADAFLAENSDNIGKRSSIDLDVLLKGV